MADHGVVKRDNFVLVLNQRYLKMNCGLLANFFEEVRIVGNFVVEVQRLKIF
jgi:hypothetical protein